MTLRITTAAAFRHDRVAAHFRLLETAEVDCLLLTYLDGEFLSHLASERQTDPAAGYVPQVATAVRLAAPRLFLEPGLRLITDAGALNPLACAEAIARILVDAGSGDVTVGVIRGDDLRESLEELYGSGCPLEHRATGAAFTELERPILAAHAELGAGGIFQALAEGARIVITGVTAPSAFAVAAAVDAFRWSWEDWEHLAGAALAGALLRHGTVLTCDLIADQFMELADAAPPIAELGPDGQLALAKIPRADGRLTPHGILVAIARTAANPAHFSTPDVAVDLTNVQVAQRPQHSDLPLWGFTGRPPNAAYSTTLWYPDGYTAAANLWLGGGADRDSGPLSALIEERVRRSGHSLESINWSAPDAANGDVAAEQSAAGLVRLRASARERAAVEQFADEVACLVRTGVVGVRSIGPERPPVEPLIREWPTLVPRELVEPVVEVRPATEWL